AGVREEVQEGLSELGLVRPYTPRVGLPPDLQPVAVALRQGPHDRGEVLEERSDVELLQVQLELPRLDLREVEDRVDQLEQMPSGSVDLLEIGHERLTT